MEDGGAEGGELDLQSRRGREAKIIIHELSFSRRESFVGGKGEGRDVCRKSRGSVEYVGGGGGEGIIGIGFRNYERGLFEQ